jgi:uncharacterized cupredoxin-like copper-binding protein
MREISSGRRGDTIVSKRGAIIALAGILALAATAAPATTAAPPAPPQRGKVPVTMREFQYEPNQLAVRPGEATFVVKNAGAIDHDFVIEDAKSKQLAQANPFAAGKTVEVRATLSVGSYSLFCSIPGHREAGMQATLKVMP